MQMAVVEAAHKLLMTAGAASVRPCNFVAYIRWTSTHDPGGNRIESGGRKAGRTALFGVGRPGAGASAGLCA